MNVCYFRINIPESNDLSFVDKNIEPPPSNTDITKHGSYKISFGFFFPLLLLSFAISGGFKGDCGAASAH